MNHHRNRYYNSEIERFMTEDPIRDGGNWYSYCEGNPVRYVDPSGLWETGDEKYPEFIQRAILRYTNSWKNANFSCDEEGMSRAHNNAELARKLGGNIVYREEWGAKDFDDWEDDIDKNAIVIHHSNNNELIGKDEKKHIKRGFSGIGYHFVIGQDGTVYEGRPINKKGAHVDGLNTGKIGVCLIGDYHPGWFEHDKPTTNQLSSLLSLIKVLEASYSIDNIKAHKDYNGEMTTTVTVCPGDTAYKILTEMNIFY